MTHLDRSESQVSQSPSALLIVFGTDKTTQFLTADTLRQKPCPTTTFTESIQAQLVAQEVDSLCFETYDPYVSTHRGVARQTGRSAPRSLQPQGRFRRPCICVGLDADAPETAQYSVIA